MPFKLNYCVFYPQNELIMYDVRKNSYNKQRLFTGFFLWRWGSNADNGLIMFEVS